VKAFGLFLALSGRAETQVADTGYFSAENGEGLPAGRDRAADRYGPAAASLPLAERLPIRHPGSENPTPVEAMAHRVTTREGKKLDALPKQIPEPVLRCSDFASFCCVASTGTRRMEPGGHGLEHEADVHPQPRLKRPAVWSLQPKTAATGRPQRGWDVIRCQTRFRQWQKGSRR
jgi:hypothetical protein